MSFDLTLTQIVLLQAHYLFRLMKSATRSPIVMAMTFVLARGQSGTSLGRQRMAPRSHLNRFSLESDWLRLGWQRRAGANFSTGGDLRRQPRGSSFRLHPRGLGRWPETAAHRGPSHYLATADLGRGYRKTVICADGFICKWGGSTNCSVGHSPERKMGDRLSGRQPA